MATLTWIRSSYGPMGWNTVKTFRLLASFTVGQTIVRIRFGWKFGGYTNLTVIPTAILGQEGTFGLVTTIGPVATDAPPDPYTAGGNAAPPAQRWLWLERRGVNLVSWDGASNTAIWADSGRSEATDAEGQVLAPTMSAGNTLNLWAVCEGAQAWDASGQAEFWFYANILTRSP